MRVGLALVCLCGVATAEPAIPALRPMPKGTSIAAMKYWAKARVAEKRGRLDDMLDAYAGAANVADDPDAYFNAAVVALRGGSRGRALSFLQLCLHHSPDAAKPKVQALIDAIKKTPSRLTIATPVPAAVVVNHARTGTAPYTLALPPGNVDYEVFSRDGFGKSGDTLRPDKDSYDEVTVNPEPGNVFISGLTMEWKDGKQSFVGERRFSLPVGTYATNYRRETGSRELYDVFCQPLRFEVKSTRDLTYVRVEAAEPKYPAYCSELTKVTQFQVKLP